MYVVKKRKQTKYICQYVPQTVERIRNDDRLNWGIFRVHSDRLNILKCTRYRIFTTGKIGWYILKSNIIREAHLVRL